MTVRGDFLPLARRRGFLAAGSWNVHTMPYDTRANILPHVAAAVPVAVGEGDDS